MNCPKCKYDNQEEDVLYCGLCYEPLKKEAKPGAPAAAPEENMKTTAGPLLTIALFAGLLSGVGVYYYGASSPDGGQTTSALETVRSRENILAAENLLAAHNRGRAELLAEISKGKLDPEGFGLEGRYTKKLFRLEEDYVNGINALRLTCPDSADKTRNAAYIKWCDDYRSKETAALEDFNKKYQELIRKAGAQ